MALVSSLKDVPISENCLVFGEIGLAGELRAVSHINARISEAIHLGFQKCIIPYHNLKPVSYTHLNFMERYRLYCHYFCVFCYYIVYFNPNYG